MSEARSRNWTFLVYPDSAPDNWRDIIEDHHIEWVESPLHDLDVNPDGPPKKPHYHILAMFGGLKSYDQVMRLVVQLNAPIPKRVHNVKSIVRYFAHLDNPEKHQYDISGIVTHGGVDIFDLLKPTSAERYTYVAEMHSWCMQNDVTEYSVLADYAMDQRRDDWWPVLVDGGYRQISILIASLRYKKRDDLQNANIAMIDKTTGEII